MTDYDTMVWTAWKILPLQQVDWLVKALEILREDFRQIGETFPSEISIIVDYPSYDISYNWLGGYRKYPSNHTIFINPSVDGLWALDILVHELVHAVTNEEEFVHGEKFLAVAAVIGLDDDGPTASAEEVLLKRLKDIQKILGPYPLVTDCLEES